MSDCCKFLYKKQNKKRLLLVTATRLASTTHPGETSTGKYQNSHLPGSARPSPQPTPNPMENSLHPNPVLSGLFPRQCHSWKAGPRRRPEVSTHSSRCPGLQPEPQLAVLAVLKAPKGAKTGQSSHQPTVTLAKPTPWPSALISKTTHPETRGRYRKGRVYPQEPGHRPNRTSTQKAASCSGHSTELGCYLPHMPTAPDWPIPNLAGYPSQAQGQQSWSGLLVAPAPAALQAENQRPSLTPRRECTGDGRGPSPGWTQPVVGAQVRQGHTGREGGERGREQKLSSQRRAR